MNVRHGTGGISRRTGSAHSNDVLVHLPMRCAQVGDKIEYIKVLDGAQNLKNGPQ